MKQHIRKLIALVLVLCMVVPMAPAAHASGWGLLGWLSGWWNSGREETKETEPPVAETEPAWNNDDPGMMLALVEDQDTVSEDVVMRASVYEADASDPVAQAELGENNVVYYPSTFFDYDLPSVTTGINKSMADLEVQYAVDNGLSTSSSGWKWKGLYFGEGGSTSGRNNRETSRTGTAVSGEVSYNQATGVRYSALAGSNVTNAATSYYYLENGTYYPVTVTRTGYSRNYTYTLYANGKQIWTGTTTSTSNTFSGVTLYTMSAETTTVTSSSYEPWVKWGGNDTAAQGPYIHSGITTGVLVDGVPQFQAPYASRLFDSSEVSGKTRYTNVGLPFILGEDGYYTFDSSYNGAYFPNGEGASNVDLILLDAPTVKQGYKSVNGSWKQAYNTCFMPFDEPAANAQSTTVTQTDGTERTTSAYRVSTGNYYFSMITPVPFTMTENGRINPSDETSEPIIFEFSGDDDVWVFIDDVLVLDLGGIHDAVRGEINFATNEIKFDTCTANMPVGDASGTYGPATSGAAISQGRIFNDENGTGKLNTTRSTFAATDNHTLTVVYMERGANLSNNKIKFNLPQKDYVAVTKQIDEMLYEQTDENVEAGPITDELFETLNARNFTYILFENNQAMTGVRFSRYDANGNFVGNGTTASDGTFNVKNGETVRFYDVEFNGVNAYHVAELDPDAGTSNNAWGTGAWEHGIYTAYGDQASVTDNPDEANRFVSDTIVTQGSTEAVDVIYFTNTNKLLSPVADIANDEFVLDFGLAVELNPLANDTYSATNDKLTLVSISSDLGSFGSTAQGQFGTLEKQGDKVIYTLTSQFTGVETFYYQVGLTSGADDLEGTYGTITIMPATTMYYEENFADLNLTGSWQNVGTAQGGYQEEGRVGTTTDSPYGSDVLYLNNTGDSYGTSKYVNLETAAATFSYTFTGTGSALYARTSDKSAYMIITVTDEAGNVVSDEWRRNTIYKPTEDTALKDNTLYNIPVYVFTAEAYGTYTVNVRLNKATHDYVQNENGDWVVSNELYTRGCDFYLDGIRVYNPANAYTGESVDPNITMIEDAYARDGEAYITVDSLRNKLLTDYTTYKPVVDENGDPVLDENGDPVYEIVWDGVNYVVFTDSNGEIQDAQTYQSAGPKEEVYMKAGQTVTFALDNWDQNQNKVFLGIKAPSGSGVVSINGNEIEINNTTDIYFDITKYANVSNSVATFKVEAESALISVTTIKVTGTADFTIVDGVE